MSVAIVGGGWVVHYHLVNLSKMEEVEIVAMATRRVETLDGIRNRIPHARFYHSLQTLIDEEKDLDAIITLPPHVHDNIE